MANQRNFRIAPLSGLGGAHRAARNAVSISLALVTLLVVLTCPQASFAQTSEACNAWRSLARADALLKEKKNEAAKVILKQLKNCPNLSAMSRFTLGWFYGRTDDFRTALEIFQAVPINVPDELTHRYAIALAQFELGNYQLSVESLRILQQQGRLDSKSADLLGVSYSKLGEYQNAYETLTSSLSRNLSDRNTYLNLITLLADAGHFSDAVNIADQAVNQFPDNPEVLVVRGAALTLQGELDRAEADFAAAVQLAPQRPSARFFLALSEYRKADYELASHTIQSAASAGVVDSDLHYLQAECLLKRDPEKTDAVLAELNSAIELNRKAVAALTLRGKLLLESGKVKEALPDLLFAHHLDPGSRSATYNLARAEFKLGKTRESQALMQTLQSQTGDALTELSGQRLHQALSSGPEQ